MAELRRNKLAQTFNVLSVSCEILERSQNNIVFLKCSNKFMQGGPGQRPWYDQCFVQINEYGDEFVELHPVNDGDADSIWFSREKMHQAFLNSVSREEARKARLIRDIEETEEKDRINSLRSRKISELLELKSHLLKEIQEIDAKSETIKGIFSNKRAKEILDQLSQIHFYSKINY